MNRNRILWLMVLSALVFVLLVLALQAPGWAVPSQSYERQTVPTQTPAPTLVPRAYLPLVVRNFVSSVP